MIIFSTVRNIPVEILEYKGISNIVSYNLTSYYADIPFLEMLNPPMEYIPNDVLSGDCSNSTFDMTYHQYIINNDSAFCQLMSIVVPEYMDPYTLVQVMIEESAHRDIITESLMKLIQQRYGNNCYPIRCLDDLLYIEPQTFSIPGLFAMDEDLARWQMLVGQPGDFRDE